MAAHAGCGCRVSRQRAGGADGTAARLPFVALARLRRRDESVLEVQLLAAHRAPATASSASSASSASTSASATSHAASRRLGPATAAATAKLGPLAGGASVRATRPWRLAGVPKQLKALRAAGVCDPT